jgi:hypothetical protein
MPALAAGPAIRAKPKRTQLLLDREAFGRMGGRRRTELSLSSGDFVSGTMCNRLGLGGIS